MKTRPPDFTSQLIEALILPTLMHICNVLEVSSPPRVNGISPGGADMPVHKRI